MRKLAAGNWKMNGLRADGVALARDLAGRAAREPLACDILVCPPATILSAVADAIAGSPVALGAQNCHAAPNGAHTGEISAAMLRDCGCTYVILGHSERRADHGETDPQVRAKVAAARSEGLIAILCVGETLAERDGGRALEVVAGQLRGSLPAGLGATEVAIAYEPVWAIGSGRIPTASQITEVHAQIRRELAELVSDPGRVRLLYGGSVKPANARALMGLANVDGALVGGASLVAAEFWEIARACT
jgi:triosephosphate isomerase